MTDQTREARFTELAVHVGLLDKDAQTQLGADVHENPLPFIHNFAESVQADDQRDAQTSSDTAVQAKESLTGAVEIEKRLHHIAKLAIEQGLSVTVSPNVDPTKVPSINVLPFHNPEHPSHQPQQPANSTTGTVQGTPPVGAGGTVAAPHVDSTGAVPAVKPQTDTNAES